MRTPEIIVRRAITDKLETAFADELSLLPRETRSMLLDDLATAFIERLKIIRSFSKIEAYPLELSE